VNDRHPPAWGDRYTLREERGLNYGPCVVWLGGGTCGHWVLGRSLAVMTVDEIADATIRSIELVQMERSRAWRRRARRGQTIEQI